MSRWEDYTYICVGCNKFISINRDSKWYCSNRCREDSTGKIMTVFRYIKKHIFDPIYQANDLGLYSIQNTRLNSKPYKKITENF